MNNEMTTHGKYRYFKSVYEATPRPDVVAQEFDRLVHLTEGAVQIAVFHEYIPMQKVASVAADATAFYLREPKCNVLVMATWEDNPEESLKFARMAAEELLSFASKSEKAKDDIGYGNYSTCLHQHFLITHFIIPQCIDGDERQVGSNEGQIATKSSVLFGKNYPRLQRLKKQYDPQLLFDKWFVIVPS